MPDLGSGELFAAIIIATVALALATWAHSHNEDRNG